MKLTDTRCNTAFNIFRKGGGGGVGGGGGGGHQMNKNMIT